MAMFKQHVMFSTVLGAGYAVIAKGLGAEPTHAILAGGLCGVAGMLPDLDSDSGRPVRELFGITAAVVPLLLFPRLARAGFCAEAVILVAAALYFLIRFGAAWVFRHYTVHRGMFHSLPAAVIAGEVGFLLHDCPEPQGRMILAGGVFLGFLSHLALDEIYGLSDRPLKFKRAGGSTFKLASSSLLATAVCWLILTGFTYVIAVDQGFLKPLNVRVPQSLAQRLAR